MKLQEIRFKDLEEEFSLLYQDCNRFAAQTNRTLEDYKAFQKILDDVCAEFDYLIYKLENEE